VSEYSIEEEKTDCSMCALGEPQAGLVLAKTMASQKARESRHPIVVRDLASGEEVARYQAGRNTSLKRSIAELRAANDRLGENLSHPKTPDKK
jgi:hypothetical protein